MHGTFAFEDLKARSSEKRRGYSDEEARTVLSAARAERETHRRWAPWVCAYRYPWLRHIFADGGYAGEKLRQALKRIGKWTIEIIKRSDRAQGFEILPRRWVVERTFGSLGRCRRLAKDFETTIASAVAWAFVAHIRVLTRRIAKA